jgi:hypothetical protein
MHNPVMRLALLLLPLLFACAPPAPASAQNFQLPIDCAVGEVCVVQNYADLDPANDTADDPRCGPLTYDGHDGLDIRVPSAMADRGVSVLAPAAGVVGAVRDGAPDGAFLSGGMAAVNGRECGNGVRIDHEGGWSSQLCHMRNGSLRVAAGDRVEAGQAIGLVGLSGHTQFPHVHITLRLNDNRVEPFTGAAAGEARCSTNLAPGAIWSAQAREALAYRGAQWFAAGFTGTPPTDSDNAETLPVNTARDAEALVFWALAIGPRQGDVLRVRLYGPSGMLVGQGARTQPRDQAQAWLFTGRRTPLGGWPAGEYRGEAQLLRNGQVVDTRTETVTLR